jgi:hypothetical protein
MGMQHNEFVHIVGDAALSKKTTVADICLSLGMVMGVELI